MTKPGPGTNGTDISRPSARSITPRIFLPMAIKTRIAMLRCTP